MLKDIKQSELDDCCCMVKVLACKLKDYRLNDRMSSEYGYISFFTSWLWYN